MFEGSKIFKVVKVLITIFLFVVFLIPNFKTEAMGNASDKLSTTWPGVASSHSITFKLTKNLPAGGKIVITPESGKFFIGSDFSYRDVSLSTSTALNAIFNNRNIASSSNTLYDGVSAVASTTNGSITITLNSTSGISSEKYVNIKLGASTGFVSTSTRHIINPTSIGSYRIDVKTYDDSGNYLERAVMMIAIVYPVKITVHSAKIRANGTPSGVLNYGSSQSIMSLTTNYTANCRWSNTASTSYSAMTETFVHTGGKYHSSIISGFTNGTTYHYYVRCLDDQGIADDTDYEITFLIAGFDGNDGSEDDDGSSGHGGSGGGGGGGSGGATGSNTGPGTGDFSPFPELPDEPIVEFSGWAYPNSKVVLLKDGVEEQTITAENNGSFSIGISELPQGVYTFNLWGEDQQKRKSTTESFTFYVRDGTKTQLYDIYLPPTIEVPSPSFDIGDSLNVLGQSASDSNIELWLYPKVVGGVTEDAVLKYEEKANTNGDWNFDLNTDSLSNGPYQVKARSSLGSQSSEFSKIVNLMVGGELPQETCAGADLNGDGKVNITDFSILLYWWTTDNACADQNSDGTVSLTDFSIMMYYWTG